MDWTGKFFRSPRVTHEARSALNCKCHLIHGGDTDTRPKAGAYPDHILKSIDRWKKRLKPKCTRPKTRTVTVCVSRASFGSREFEELRGKFCSMLRELEFNSVAKIWWSLFPLTLNAS